MVFFGFFLGDHGALLPYSMAIALLEYLAEHDMHLPIQIFATDISETAIETARRGQYPENISGDMSDERLQRYFVHSGDGYQMGKAVRDLCVFARTWPRTHPSRISTC